MPWLVLISCELCAEAGYSACTPAVARLVEVARDTHLLRSW